MKLLSPELWLLQAKADEAASRASVALADCHRRYFLQQAYEKAVKALALACVSKRQCKDKQFASALGDHFLHHHTPWTVFSTKDDTHWGDELRRAYGDEWPRLLRELKALRTAVATKMKAGANATVVGAWMKIDATRPTKVLEAVSYRYPFVDAGHPDGIAPKDFQDWSEYQGTEQLVRDAINDLLKRAAVQVSLWTRAT